MMNGKNRIIRDGTCDIASFDVENEVAYDDFV